MLRDDEWIKLLDYLLQCLTNLKADEIVSSIRASMSTRIVEKSLPYTNQLSVLNISNQSDPPVTLTRSLTSKEAFIKAIEVIETRLEMLPNIGRKASELLQSSEIVWLPEDYEDNTDNQLLSSLAGVQVFSSKELKVLDVQTETQKELKRILQDLKDLLQEA